LCFGEKKKRTGPKERDAQRGEWSFFNPWEGEKGVKNEINILGLDQRTQNRQEKGGR